MANSALRRVSLRNLAAHKVRLALTVLSVVLGTAFVTGSFVFTDTLGHTFHGIFADVAKGVAVQVSGPDGNGSGVPVADIPRIAAVPGVTKVDPEISAQLVLLGAGGKPVQSGGAPTEGLAYTEPGQRIGDPYHFVAGSPPTEAGQIALNHGAMKLAKLELGSRTKVLVANHDAVTVTVVGVYDTKTDTGGYVGALFTHSQAMALLTDGRHVNLVDVAGAGVSQSVLKQRIAEAVPGLTYKTGAQVTRDTQNSIDTVLQFINYFLLAFGAIALLVGTFIIYNTFSMIVAQRVRELALLRAIGASRRQVNRSVLFEAGTVGLAGSVLGIGGGLGLAYGLRAFLNQVNVGLPSGPLQLQPRTIVVALAVGVLVTLFSAYAPARRAAKTPPVAAMRAEFAPATASLRRRTAAGIGFVALALVALGFGATASGGSGAALVGLGALLMILGVLLGSPALSRPVVNTVGSVLTAPFGSIGKLARTNAVRNPRRTAATAFALTLGLMLVSAIAVFGASAKYRVNQLIDNNVRADFILTGPDATGVPYRAGQAVDAVAGVASTVKLYPVTVKFAGGAHDGSAVDGPLPQLIEYNVTSGSGRVQGSDLLVSATSARSHHWHVGSNVAATTVDGASAPLQVSGIYADNPLLGPWVTSGDYYRRVTAPNHLLAEVILVKAAAGTPLAALRTGLESATDPYLVVKVQDRQQFKGSQATAINQLLAILYGLLALAVVIAVLGIINTLALSVVERRREIGMLRAVGMLRAQVRRAIYLESGLIAIFGALVGLVLGLGFGALFVHSLRRQGLTHIAIPVGQAVTILVLATLVGVVAAVWPAIRAARTRPLAAIADS